MRLPSYLVIEKKMKLYFLRLPSKRLPLFVSLKFFQVGLESWFHVKMFEITVILLLQVRSLIKTNI